MVSRLAPARSIVDEHWWTTKKGNVMWEFTLECGHKVQRVLKGVPNIPTRLCEECLTDPPRWHVLDYRCRG